MDQRANAQEKEQIRTAIVRTALKHHLVSQYTSLIAVDVTPSRAKVDKLNKTSVPGHLPQGWQYNKVFGSMPRTATDARFNFIMGFLLLAGGLYLRRYIPRV